jgi:hypothetical protein
MSPQYEWLSSRIRTKTNAGEDAEIKGKLILCGESVN